MPRIFLAIGVLLIGYGLALDRVLDWIGTLPYALRLLFCFVLIFPPAFLMGFPMPIAMTWLSRLGKDHMFLWAWGINGCFSVVGAALVPVIATSFGLAAVLMVSGCAYLLAILGFFAVLLPLSVTPEPQSRVTCAFLAGHRAHAWTLAGRCRGSVLRCRCNRPPRPRKPPRPNSSPSTRRLSPIPASRPARTSRSSTSRRTAGAAISTDRGGVYWEDITYSDRRALLHIPKGFDPARPAVMVVYFHGNQATLERDVDKRQQVPRQVAQSGLNAVLVAPQFAVDALDSSAGQFYEPGAFRRFVEEAGLRLAKLHGGRRAKAAFESLPVLLVAYSGGYQPAAWAANHGDIGDRLRGIILLDALYAKADKFADWIAGRESAIFLSAHSRSAREENLALQRRLTERGIDFATSLPTAHLAPGSVTFIAAADEIAHQDFVSKAWVDDPLKVVLSKVPGFSRRRAARRR